MSRLVLKGTTRGRWALNLLSDKHLLAAMNEVANIVDANVQRQMVDSRRPDGTRLASVSRWTRVAGGYNPAARVLNRTGTLRKAHKPKVIKASKVVYGPSGRMIPVANRMIEGGPSTMPVDPGQIRTGQNGQQYIRIQLNDGSWRTKRVRGGRVRIHVRPRPYLGLSNKATKQIDRAIARGLEART